jgi:prepilin signal peptidase PulO-like enzyme (type II secretory pathway)
MIVVALILIGLCLGSFVNALVWRLHEQEAAGKAGKKPTDYHRKLSITKGRSMCPECHHELAAKDLIPVVSWLWLRGNCRYCHKPISRQYPLVELLTAGLFVISYIWWPFVLQGLGLYYFVFWLIFLVGFMALALYDLRWQLLPNRMVYPLIGLAIIQLAGAMAFYDVSWRALITAFWGIIVASGLFYAIFLVSRGEWIGGGDVKLGVILGILLGGPLMSLLMLFVASCLGTVAGLPLLLEGKRKVRVPFGPFLLLATIFVTLFGASIIHWYKTKLLLS